ncbi:eicosanoid and glutathione metabolism membrane protein [Sulfitobacter donghicola DSW-25 = KCTC 12864 = JCM 14565]|uniref:Eicosanoid and glutathione metabolism membrane protein n=2 Tax=Sulfitobacter TaxID=60136 RepID=A0A073IVC1_9RHOB|nr:MAPEG family protein [Sulfitobacter donghicola]KEJ89337.1 eicosanoid and glutathione metabolism membrane protein [Sulfitobacter donghicola DSW-25 = KCTC 12864 = JCM 14565]
MPLAITPLYAGLLALIFIVLSVLVIRERFAVKSSVGDGGDQGLIKRMRIHANFAEYAPLGLILMLCAELQGAPAVAVHAMGASLLLGRFLHAVGMSRTPQIIALRQAGILLTFAMLTLSALTLIGHSIF